MLDSYIEELKSIRAAILKLTADPLSSQSVSSAGGGSMSASYVDLAKLHARERELVTLIAEMHREQNGGGSLGLSYGIFC